MQNNVHSETHKNEARSGDNVENSPYLLSLPFSKKNHLSTYQILLDVKLNWFNTVSIIEAEKDSKLNVCS